ncbi:N-acetylmuramoyl-L-alanine amidase [Natronincola ferrireducens]|uniref:N-acetylmuramoyl-L-alanine amidase n=1 Tax=Natronincola ferrireducens TaxID=393762 RepID=A0A1G9I8D2_9FIRM|nr:N-acetylmuramoyl-L-alanine amidase [Natronincola ferrireducens]SDL21094.1 N-acetylmuramoyl-L-alanine amidase [Natronincola ferrireducens]
MNPLIVISAGHGGSDPGAVANGMLEKDYTLLISLYQYKRFKESGVPVSLVRDWDIALGNVLRASMVKNSGAKYCIDNHCNAAVSTSAQGVEVIHSIHNDGKLAHAIVEALAAEGIPKRATPVYCRSLPNNSKQDYYFMHRWTGNVQTNIIEYDFISNTQGAQRIKENWERYAEAVVRAYCLFLNIPYKAPIVKVDNDPILEWAKRQGYNIAKADDKITYRELWEVLYGTLQIEEPKEKPKEEPKGELREMKHYKIALTDVVEVDPLALKVSVQDMVANRINLSNFVTSGYQWHHENGTTYPLGILVSEGRVINDRQPHGKPAGTLIVYKNGSVAVKELLSIKGEKDVWFAVSGCGILPTINMASAGFVGAYSDIARSTDRPVIGYNPEKKKIVIAVRPSSDINRGQLTLKNLGCTMGITLDGGGSTVLKVGGKLIKSTTRRLYSVITW